MKIVLLYTHMSPLILYLYRRKSSGDGRVALVLENLLLITINPSMLVDDFRHAHCTNYQSQKGMNLEVIMDGITSNFAMNSFISFMFKATFHSIVAID